MSLNFTQAFDFNRYPNRLNTLIKIYAKSEPQMTDDSTKQLLLSVSQVFTIPNSDEVMTADSRPKQEIQPIY